MVYLLSKTASKIVDSHLTNVLKQDIELNSSSDLLKLPQLYPYIKEMKSAK